MYCGVLITNNYDSSIELSVDIGVCDICFGEILADRVVRSFSMTVELWSQITIFWIDSFQYNEIREWFPVKRVSKSIPTYISNKNNLPLRPHNST